MRRILIIAAVLALLIPAINTPKTALAEGDEYYVICTPDGEVNVRKHAKIRSEAIGGLGFGSMVLSDGKKRNGFIHIYDLAAEDTTGWVSSGYLVKDEPREIKGIGYIVSNGRVAARKCINGKRRAWLMPGSEVEIYAISDEWCVTDEGFIKTEFLEIWEQED